MKRLGYVLTEETVTTQLCKTAIIAASKGKRNRASVKGVLKNLDKASAILKNIILEGRYKPSSYTPCLIIDRPSGKERLLQKPKFFPDQCVHHAAIKLAEDKLFKRLDPYCIGSVPGRGQIYGHKAIRRWLTNDVKDTKYVAKGDIHHCYQSIKPEYIMSAFEKIFKDKRYLELIRVIAYSYPSLPLGNYTSAWFSNILLLAIDNIARQDKAVSHYLRYIDDFIFFGRNKRKLHNVMDKIQTAAESIGLEVKANWQIFPVDSRGVDILGYRYFRDKTILRKRNSLAIIRQTRRIANKQRNNKPISFKEASGFLSRIGSLTHCRGGKLYQHIRHVNISKIKEVVRHGKDRDNSNAGARRRH